jgi:MFS family permease
MFPQLGSPLGFVLSGGIFLALSHWLTNDQLFAWGWRLPFLASAVLVLLGLYVRLSITETPVFQAAAKRATRASVPMFTVLGQHLRSVVAGVFVCLATFTLFYLMTVFALSWGTTALHYDRGRFLILQLIGILFFAVTIPISAWLAERGRRPVMFGVTVAIGAFGLVLEPLFTAGPTGALEMMIIGMALMGFTYGPLGTVVSEMFPTNVRYTGSSLSFSLAGILGASLAPYAATWLATHYGLQYVGYYLTATAAVSFVGLLMIQESKDYDLAEGLAEGLEAQEMP